MTISAILKIKYVVTMQCFKEAFACFGSQLVYVNNIQ